MEDTLIHLGPVFADDLQFTWMKMPRQNFARSGKPGRRQNTSTTTFVTSVADSERNPPVVSRSVAKPATTDPVT